MRPDEDAIKARVRRWLFEDALPLWAAQGVDPAGGFYEQLTFEGRPDAIAGRRMRVQARQLYVFSEALLLGWKGGAERIVDSGLSRFVETCWAADGRPGWCHGLDPQGRATDHRRDAYDHAFALFALAFVHRATGDPRARAYADSTLAYMDDRMADRRFGGVQESDPPAPPRRSNPHMHLLEAMLAWHEASGDPTFLGRAAGLVKLCETRFYDRESRTLGEYFADDFAPAPPPAGQVVEPGHHFEWVWLLLWAESLGLRVDQSVVAGLFEFGVRHGLDGSGYAVDELDRTGRTTRATRRLWPQTELIKAALRVGTPGERSRGFSVAAALFEDYLAPGRGLWQDQFDGSGRPCASVVPASTLYHLSVCFRELLRA
jgi:mannose-6-phosphate isomerase